ncbi:monofunctional biosynthetic peptidoglycan transglycosylase [Candidatus Nitronereus thalassa]|uniref:Biosynthetic peptidoglycan transglycosylase n=1 Tax=Candidatus Nitronereus thalassa TaxID=3020898 RepID=A0ABU3KCP0_9BACT|nr:monofunctional biosynthetic peptidoglycan transglycosylase [Candidatus Nitronereus thalassa]MDT7044078.1 monofunctional biosynthetic peptidoglycan transglycosylase [Candidatus Nitronereus thalassa]
MKTKIPRPTYLWQTQRRQASWPQKFGTVLLWAKTHKVVAMLSLLCLYLLIEIATIPFWSIAQLETKNPAETALMQQRRAEAEAEGKSFHITQHWVPLSQIPKNVRRAILVSEDSRFYSHAGVDWQEVQESVETNFEQGRMARGGSTITQQLAKNLYLSTDKTLRRKAKELLMAYTMESQLSKGRILELYLNVIEWGGGVFGIEAAAQQYFGKSSRFLTAEEGARLAAVIPRPLQYRPDQNSPYVRQKKDLILQRMKKVGS